MKTRLSINVFSVGSALILTVVLTSLLAIVGVLFLLVARIDKIATSAISENRQLNLAVESVTAQISQQLALDIPRADPNGRKLQEYYDYPGPEDRWLACLEPYQYGLGDYRWRQISDIYNRLGSYRQLRASIVPDYQAPIDEGLLADADGDGVADSVWVMVPDMTTSKGKPIFAAVRIVDNGGMLNVNTACKFDPYQSNVPPGDIDGSSQLQINLAWLSRRGVTNGTLDTAANRLQAWRCGPMDANLAVYERNVIWYYGSSNGPYTTFDIGDELKLRYRYILNNNKITTRIEKLWTKAYDWGRKVPLTNPQAFAGDPGYWFYRANNSSSDPNLYDYRHISTTYNMDRIINPLGPAFNNGRMINVNKVTDNTKDVQKLFSAIYAGLYDANFVGSAASQIAAQVAVNLIDYRDKDDKVTAYTIGPDTYYGFEQPCIYISELTHKFVQDASEPTIIYRSYAVELYKPYSKDSSPTGWRLVVDGNAIDINNWGSARQFYVVKNEDSKASFGSISNADVKSSSALTFTDGTKIDLRRQVAGGGYITVDSVQVPATSGSWLRVDGQARSIQRDIRKHKCIRRLWDSSAKPPTLGAANSYVDSSAEMIQAHPANRNFTNIGEIGMVFAKSAYSQGPNPIGPSDTELTARVNLANPVFQQIFNYLTVFDPTNYNWPLAETRIKGRININTASWFVIAQLPWMTPQIAQAITTYRDTASKGFTSIGELNNVVGANPVSSMDYYARDSKDLAAFPDLTKADGAVDDFEERDVIFARVSNLVTVRSDVFTAYILVRLGADGPQKRMVVILDRSKVKLPTEKVKVVALHSVSDPR